MAAETFAGFKVEELKDNRAYLCGKMKGRMIYQDDIKKIPLQVDQIHCEPVND